MKKVSHLSLAVSTVFVLIFGFGRQVEASKKSHDSHGSGDSHKKHKAHWGYDGKLGPKYWGKLKKEFVFCARGKKQSPIDINRAIETRIGDIKFSYHDVPLKIINNGHTIQVNYAPGSSAELSGKTYKLLQFHFHTPSENTVDGAPYDMEMHLVHKNRIGGLGVVAVFMKKGEHNSALGKLWSNLTEEENKEKVVKYLNINASDLLPEDKTYYHFNGSLTTPPCSEGVDWNVLKTPVEVSEKQIAKFKKLFRHNARPVQPLNNREVLLSR
jgi:carbonic anhydrase